MLINNIIIFAIIYLNIRKSTVYQKNINSKMVRLIVER